MIRAVLLAFLLAVSLLFSMQPSVIAQVDAGEFLQSQQDNLARAYSMGLNRKPCLNILRAQGSNGQGIVWLQLFNVGYWIPVIPDECVRCVENVQSREIECPNQSQPPENRPGGGQYTASERQQKAYELAETVPLSPTLIPAILIRLYGLMVSLSIYALVLVTSVVGLRFLINALGKNQSYKDTATNLRTVFAALGITIIVGTLLLQLLVSALSINENSLEIPVACIPTTSSVVYSLGGETFSAKDFCPTN